MPNTFSDYAFGKTKLIDEGFDLALKRKINLGLIRRAFRCMDAHANCASLIVASSQ